MNQNLIKLMAILTLMSVFITTVTAFEGFRPIFHPPTISILEALRNDEDNFSILTGLIRESGLDELRKEGKSFTLLAPTNAAFAKLPGGTLESLKRDKNKLRQLLFNHLLPGKVLFKKMFEPDTPAHEGQRTTKSLTNLGNRLAYFQCNEHKAYAETVHLPLINGKAQVLESDFEGQSAVIQVIDTVLLPEDNSPTSVNSDSLPVRNETTSGLNTTIFDTLVGTVTVNLPDDLAAGDTISGTVIAEVKKQTVPADQTKNAAPRDEAKMQDELSGYVVEVATQETPIKKQDDGSTGASKKWSIPEGFTSIPVVLKNKDGQIVSQMKVPVSPKGNVAMVHDISTPSIGQAGRPLSVKGSFDGDYKNTAIKLGKQTAKFLASSPRKIVVESPRDLKGITDIEVEYKGKLVAKCVYRNISIKLSADKLNLIKGEQTTLTATLSGMVGLLSPVLMQISNKSPGTVSMEGGETQIITVNPQEVNGDNFTAKRILTGVKAGGFIINASVDPDKSIQGNGGSCNSGNTENIPVTPVLSPSPENPNGQPTSTPTPNNGTGQPVNPFRARYRVTFNGFTVNHVTNHGLFQRPDAVTFHPKVGRVMADGSSPSAFSSGDTTSIGMTPENAVSGGTSPPNGGLVTNDGFPTQNTPWRRTLPRSPAPLTIPPTIYFEGEIVQNTDAVWITPNIWNVDGHSNLNLARSFDDQIRRDLEALQAAVVRIIRGPQPLALTSYLRSGNSMGINNTMSLAAGVMQDRPIGMQPLGGNRFGFTPQVLVLTYDSADFMSRTNFGFGPGIVPVRYTDANEFGGDYTLYFQVERLDTQPPCAASIIGSSFTGSSVLTTNHDRAPGPYTADINLTVDFTDCRGTIRITNFPPIVTPPFEVRISEGNVRQNITTVTQSGGGIGTLDPVTGSITIPVTLHFQHSIETEFGPILAGQSDLTLTLTTEGTGGRRLSGGNFTLVGSGSFLRGFLGTKTGNITVTGTFSPQP